MKFFLTALSIIISGCLVTLHAQADKVLGTYATPKKDGQIIIYKKGDHYFGKVHTAIKDLKDTKNPNPALRNRKIIGSDFITGLKYNDGEYTGGKIYDPQTGKTYDCKMWMTGNKLNVRGFMGTSILGQTVAFTKIK